MNPSHERKRLTDQEREAISDFLRERGALQVPRGMSGEYTDNMKLRFMQYGSTHAPRTLRGKAKDRIVQEMMSGIPRRRYENV